MSSEDDAKKTISMIKIIGPWASVFLIGFCAGILVGRII